MSKRIQHDPRHPAMTRDERRKHRLGLLTPIVGNQAAGVYFDTERLRDHEFWNLANKLAVFIPPDNQEEMRAEYEANERRIRKLFKEAGMEEIVYANEASTKTLR